MRVVMISKALVVGAYHSKLTELAALPNLELIAIVPPAWRDERGSLPLERTPTRGYQLITTPLRFNGDFHMHHYPQLPWLLRQLRPDLVHIDEEPYNLATCLALRSAQSIGARSLFFSWQNLNRRYPLPFNLLERYVLSHSAAAIAGNRDAADVWRAKGYRGPIEVIPQFGVDPITFAPESSKRSISQFVIGYAGRFVEEKGADVLLQALAGLDGDWRADLIGSGPWQDRLIELARSLGVADRVRFLPWVSSHAIADVYRSFDVLVLPSRSKPNWIEQFGRVLVEAMACGVPVIGSTCGEIPNVIGDAGLIFPESDVEALREHLRCLQSQPALHAELAQRGRQRVLDHFTQAQIARKTHEVYHRVMGRLVDW
ncbi:MAG: glycosyltransferase family 4 protein [Chloroflexi bacterium]|nr:glycosyltransferase family 4 protein [Chloroflexota bacterium]